MDQFSHMLCVSSAPFHFSTEEEASAAVSRVCFAVSAAAIAAGVCCCALGEVAIGLDPNGLFWVAAFYWTIGLSNAGGVAVSSRRQPLTVLSPRTVRTP
ncbi:MAG: hypothetical protein Q8K78_09430 [Planctomycetaceae bacterium]|nr:hypothetical protein [Planctomycetaceae bacterium]